MKIIDSSILLAASLALTAEAWAPRQLLQAFQWPIYSQQCADDAGPPFMDDAETFGPNGRYHDGSQAQAVLVNGECAGPVKDACSRHSGGASLTPRAALTAYLEGPVQCGGKGWFCRILPDEQHHNPDDPKIDWNFSHCNRTDYGDTDGHCHGSDNDDVFYWWARDHWHRNYAGRLHCCCDWSATANVVARCDYRKPLRQGENANCRDANEEHSGGYEAGCTNLGTTAPLPEPSQDQCWTVTNFAPGGASGGFVFDTTSFGPGTGGDGLNDNNEGEGQGGEDQQDGDLTDNNENSSTDNADQGSNDADDEVNDNNQNDGSERPTQEEPDNQGDLSDNNERPTQEEESGQVSSDSDDTTIENGSHDNEESHTGETGSDDFESHTGEDHHTGEEGEESHTGEWYTGEEEHEGELNTGEWHTGEESEADWHTGEEGHSTEEGTHSWEEEDQESTRGRQRPRSQLFGGRRGRM